MDISPAIGPATASSPLVQGTFTHHIPSGDNISSLDKPSSTNSVTVTPSHTSNCSSPGSIDSLPTLSPMHTTTENNYAHISPDSRFDVPTEPQISHVHRVSQSHVVDPIQESISVPNSHHMITRSKNGVFKKKCLIVKSSNSQSDPALSEPHSYKVALKIPQWQAAMQE